MKSSSKAKTYITFCKKCNEKTKHYVVTSGCVTCQKVYIDYITIQKRQLGIKQYNGSPCKTCGNTLRYVGCRNCVECAKQNRHKYDGEYQPGQGKWHQIKNKYGIDKDEWYWLLKEQNYQCRICKKEMSIEKNSGDICVDHDHKTGRVRGLLCKKCNLFIGLAKEDVSILNSAIIYVKEVCEKNVI